MKSTLRCTRSVTLDGAGAGGSSVCHGSAIRRSAEGFEGRKVCAAAAWAVISVQSEIRISARAAAKDRMSCPPGECRRTVCLMWCVANGTLVGRAISVTRPYQTTDLSGCDGAATQLADRKRTRLNSSHGY